VRAIEERGGLRYVFLTHQDDVADAARYAAHFGAQRIIHQADRRAMPDAEILIDGDDPRAFGDITIVPTPGHSRGSCVLHYRTYLFSGDHVAWDREAGKLRAHRTYSYDYARQLRSVERLTAYDITWLLPGPCDAWGYLPWRRRWMRVFLSSLRCFFLAIRLRRFLTTEPTPRTFRTTTTTGGRRTG